MEDGDASGRAGGRTKSRDYQFIRWIMSRNKKKLMITCHVNRLKCSYDKTVVLPYNILITRQWNFLIIAKNSRRDVLSLPQIVKFFFFTKANHEFHTTV